MFCVGPCLIKFGVSACCTAGSVNFKLRTKITSTNQPAALYHWYLVCLVTWWLHAAQHAACSIQVRDPVIDAARDLASCDA